MSKFNFREVAPLLFAVFIDVFGFSLAFPTLTEIFKGASSPFAFDNESSRYVLLAMSYGAYTLGMFFGATFLGDLSDIIKRKKVILISLTGLTFCYIVMALSIQLTLIWLLILARLLAGLFAGNFPTAMASIVDLSTPQNKAAHMAFVGVAQSLGWLTGSALGGILADQKLSRHFGLKVPFYAGACLTVLAFIWIYFSYTETFTLKTDKKFSFKRGLIALWEGAKHRKVRLISISFFLMQLGITSFFILLPLLLIKRFHFTGTGIGLFGGLLGIPFCLSGLVGVPLLARWFKAEKIAEINLFLTAPFIALAGVMGSYTLLIVASFFYAFFHQNAFATIFAAYSNAVDEENQGWVMGISVSSIAIAWTVASFVSTLVPILGLPKLFILGGVFYLISAFVMLYYVKRVARL